MSLRINTNVFFCLFLLFLIVLTACGAGVSSPAPTKVELPEDPASAPPSFTPMGQPTSTDLPPTLTPQPATQTPTPTTASTETPAPTPEDRELTLCMGEIPWHFFIYGEPWLVNRNAMQMIYDGPIERADYEYQPIILEKLPSLADGDAEL